MRKDFWDRLAAVIHSREGSEAIELLRQAGLLKADGEPPKSVHEFFRSPRANNEPGHAENGEGRAHKPIGAWQPRVDGDEVRFVRFTSFESVWWSPAAPTVLKPKSDSATYRICMIGESAASGMFFTPFASPSLVLESLLNQLPRSQNIEKFEVIDLARNSAWIELLVELSDASAQLLPDALVVYAGNNFFGPHQHHEDGSGGRRLADVAAANDAGALGLLRSFRKSVQEDTKTSLSRLVAQAQERGIDVLFLIPASCETWERPSPVAWLGQGRTRKWYELYEAAIAAHSDADFETALAHGEAMLALDERSCSTSLRVVANALLALGRAEEAVNSISDEIDASQAFATGFPTPGTSRSTANTMKEVADAFGIQAIDMREVFSSYLGKPTLDHSLFVDYCHLSLEGMQVAMSAVCAGFNRLLKGDLAHSDWQFLLENTKTFEVSPDAEARAIFCSGLYTSHIHQLVSLEADESDLKQRFSTSIGLSESIKDIIRYYLRLRNPAMVPELSVDATSVRGASNHPLDNAVTRWVQGIDRSTMEALCGAMDAHDEEGTNLLTEYQAAHWNDLQRGLDLLHPTYYQHYPLFRPVTQMSIDLSKKDAPPILKATWPRSDFVMVADGNHAVNCSLTMRLPLINGKERPPGVAVVLANGQETFTTSLAANWERFEFQIEATKLSTGFNQVSIKWPPLPADDDAALFEAKSTFHSEQKSRWFPCFGEMFSFKCKASA